VVMHNSGLPTTSKKASANTPGTLGTHFPHDRKALPPHFPYTPGYFQHTFHSLPGPSLQPFHTLPACFTTHTPHTFQPFSKPFCTIWAAGDAIRLPFVSFASRFICYSLVCHSFDPVQLQMNALYINIYIYIYIVLFVSTSSSRRYTFIDLSLIFIHILPV